MGCRVTEVVPYNGCKMLAVVVWKVFVCLKRMHRFATNGGNWLTQVYPETTTITTANILQPIYGTTSVNIIASCFPWASPKSHSSICIIAQCSINSVSSLHSTRVNHLRSPTKWHKWICRFKQREGMCWIARLYDMDSIVWLNYDLTSNMT